jgi:hypothetical protein
MVWQLTPYSVLIIAGADCTCLPRSERFSSHKGNGIVSSTHRGGATGSSSRVSISFCAKRHTQWHVVSMALNVRANRPNSDKTMTRRLLIYKSENKPCFSLELSRIQFINYSLHFVDLFHSSCHDISILVTSLVTRTNAHLLQYYVFCLIVDYCMCLQTRDSILTSVTIIRHL